MYALAGGGGTAEHFLAGCCDPHQFATQTVVCSSGRKGMSKTKGSCSMFVALFIKLPSCTATKTHELSDSSFSGAFNYLKQSPGYVPSISFHTPLPAGTGCRDSLYIGRRIPSASLVQIKAFLGKTEWVFLTQSCWTTAASQWCWVLVWGKT